MSVFKFLSTFVASARALENAAIVSLCGRGLVVRERGGPDSMECDAAPYVTLSVREDCGCGLADNQYEFALLIHVRGFSNKPREVMRMTDEAERAALMVGIHLRQWQILHISVERVRILRHISGGWLGCLSVRALLAPKD